MDGCNMISDITNIALVLAAWAGAIIAFFGLMAWQRELHGRADFKLARRVMLDVYELHNEIQQIRNIFSPELLDKQYERLNKKASKLNVALLEAKVLWGDKLERPTQTLHDSLKTWRLALRKHLRTQKGKMQLTDEELEKIDAILYGDGDEDDEFGKGVEQAVAAFEDALGPYLKRRN